MDIVIVSHHVRRTIAICFVVVNIKMIYYSGNNNKRYIRAAPLPEHRTAQLLRDGTLYTAYDGITRNYTEYCVDIISEYFDLNSSLLKPAAHDSVPQDVSCFRDKFIHD